MSGDVPNPAPLELPSAQEGLLTYGQLLAERDAWRERAETAVAANEGLQAALHDATRKNKRIQFELEQSHGVIQNLGQLVIKANNATEQAHAQNAKLAEQAKRDHLTGLLNRRSASEEYDRLRPQGTLRSTDRLSLVILDLDRFKSVNDAHGHEVGDKALKGVARILKQLTREGDLTFRWGGEEFVVMLPGADEAGALIVAENLRQVIKDEVITTASFGVAEVRPHEALDSAIDRVDTALYAAKNEGRNRVVLHSHLADR